MIDIEGVLIEGSDRKGNTLEGYKGTCTLIYHVIITIIEFTGLEFTHNKRQTLEND